MGTGKIETTLLIIVIISLIFNGVLFWYASKVLGKLTYIYENMMSMQNMNTSYIKHLEGVNEMETYFGDPTIGELIKHTKFVAEQYQSINEIFEDLEDGFITIEIEEEAEINAKEEIG